MDTAANVLAIILAVICLVGAVGDFKELPQVVEIMDRLNVPRRIIPLAGAAKLGGAIGLLLGLRVDWLGVLAAACLTAYFVIATALHVRVRDTFADTAPAVAMLVFAAATFVVSL